MDSGKDNKKHNNTSILNNLNFVKKGKDRLPIKIYLLPVTLLRIFVEP